LAPISLTALHPLAGAVTGLSAGAAVTLLWPGALGNAVGLLLAGGGMLGSALVAQRRAAAQREQVFAALGEVKVKLAANAIRLDSLVQRVDQMPMRETDAAPARAAINELTAEVGLLGDLLQQVATTLADHDDQIASAQARLAPPPEPVPVIPVPVIDPEAAHRARAEAIAAERAKAAEIAARRAADERAAVISAALAEGKVEIHLQPVVELPRRRTKGYEALVRLRLDEKTLLLPADFLSVVEERGFGPTLDALVLTRALAIARHLGARDGGKEGSLFVSCNFSLATWGSSRALATLARILDKYREHAGTLVVEMPQRVFRALDPTSLGLLGAMSATGLRFALDQVGDLRLDPVALFDRGIRFVKVPAALLQAEADRPANDLDVGDLAALLARGSVTLIAEKIEDNPTVADMIELGVTHAQGLVFAPPRPVKPDVFADPEPAQTAAPAVPEAAASPRPPAEILGYPQARPVVPNAEPPLEEGRPERMPFRSVLRRA
jgi:cyclic-di-GMP phosphodiesterase TipF (flagellum assembly factor)